ncbi:MAG: bifunctional metallophosphatase/5'-nucleotidase [Armatimonadota bacterium]
MSTITILHTNDFHGKLTTQAEGIIAGERESTQSSLLLDSGDAISSGNIYFNPFGESILKRMSDLKYDAMAMGNREFHFLTKGLESKLRLSKFPVLCANIAGDSSYQYVSSCVRLTIGEMRVIIFGLTVPMITEKMTARKFSPFIFHDPIATAIRLVPTLRPECDLLIALTHIGLKNDRILAESVEGIDIIAGGHSHTNLYEPLHINRTFILQAGWWGHFLGKAEFELKDDGIRLVNTQHIDLRQAAIHLSDD